MGEGSIKDNNNKKITHTIKKALIISSVFGCLTKLYDCTYLNSYAEDINLEKHAQELVLIAKNSKSNIDKELAQDAINKLADGLLKTSLQEKIDNISTISLKQSSNIDVYIKPQNILSLSLSTNNITFEDFDGTEDTIIPGAIDLTVDSTLPYDLNSYLKTDFYNADRTKQLDRSVLSSQESSSSDYKVFTQLNEKVTLLADCVSASNKIHSIDMKLNSTAHEADVYKGVIKFEIEQK